MAKKRTQKSLSHQDEIPLESMPFSLRVMSAIFQTQTSESDRVVSRENNMLEFKESFHWGSRTDYARTMAAFANNRGGYIVFGISDKPRRLKGLSNTKFDEFDPVKMTECLNEYFSPEIEWQMATHQVGDKRFGLLFVNECKRKPVICRKNGTDLSESAIYYRYRGQTSQIKYSEFRALLEQQRERDQELIFRHLRKFAEIGPQNVGILDARTGLVEGAGGSFLIDEELLPKIKFIREGHFNENSSAPAIKLVGHATAIEPSLVQPLKSVFRSRALGTHDIILAFLNQERVDEPLEYVKRICFEQTAAFPVYYFISLAKCSTEKAIEELSKVITTNQGKKALIARLKSAKNFELPVGNAQTNSSQTRKRFSQEILQKNISVPSHTSELKYFLQSIRSVKKEDVNLSYLGPILGTIFNEKYENGGIASEFRQCLCHLDAVLFKQGASKGA